MPPRGRKRKSDGNEDIAPTSPTPPEVVKKLPRRSNKAVKPLAEHAADDGRASARSFLRAAASTKKRRLPACNAKKEVQKQADEILALSKKSGSVSLNITKIAPLLALRDEHKDVFRAALDDRQSRSFSVPELIGQYLNDCLAIANDLRSMSKRSTGIKQPEWMCWKQDIKDLNYLNRRAFDLGRKIVEQNILGAVNGKTPPLQMSRRAGDVEKLAWEMFEDVMPRAGEATWGTVANAQLRALVAMGKVVE